MGAALLLHALLVLAALGPALPATLQRHNPTENDGRLEARRGDPFDDGKGDPLDTMITGSMVGGSAVFDHPDSPASAEPALLEARSESSVGSPGIGFGPSSWVDKLVKSYTQKARTGKAAALGHERVKIVQNNNLLSHLEQLDHTATDQEEGFKRTQEAGKKAVSEQRSKEKDEAGQKRLEQAQKAHVLKLKQKMKEEQLKLDEEQDAKEVEEEKVKAGEAERKRKLETQTKQDVNKLKSQMEEEQRKAAVGLEKKKKEEQTTKSSMEDANKKEVHAAVQSSNEQRSKATKEMAEKRRQEGEAKQRESQQEEKEKDAEDAKKQSEFAEAHFKRQEDMKSTIRGPAFQPVKGMVVATHQRLFPSQNWTNAYTYSLWLKLEETQSDWSSLLHKGQQNWDRNPFFAIYPGQSRLHVRSGTRPNPPDWSGDTNVGCDPAELLPLKQWIWVAMTHRAGAMNVFFGDGRSLRSVCAAALNAPVQNTGPLYACDTFHMVPRAQIADLRVFNRVLPQDEMQKIMEKRTGVS